MTSHVRRGSLRTFGRQNEEVGAISRASAFLKTRALLCWHRSCPRRCEHRIRKDGIRYSSRLEPDRDLDFRSCDSLHACDAQSVWHAFDSSPVVADVPSVAFRFQGRGECLVLVLDGRYDRACGDRDHAIFSRQKDVPAMKTEPNKPPERIRLARTVDERSCFKLASPAGSALQ